MPIVKPFASPWWAGSAVGIVVGAWCVATPAGALVEELGSIYKVTWSPTMPIRTTPGTLRPPQGLHALTASPG